MSLEENQNKPEVAASGSPTRAIYNITTNPLYTKWFPSKDSLFASNSNPSIIIAKDVNSTGAKAFATLNHASDFSSYLGTVPKPNLYEVIPEIKTTPVYIYMDLDKELGPLENHAIDYDTLLARFEQIFSAFMQYVYHIPISLERGCNYQVAYTPINPSKPKLSLHIKINIVCCNVETLKTLIVNLDRYMSSNLYITPSDRQLFYYYKFKNKQQRYVPVIDQTVYTNFRGYRTLYSSKLHQSNAMVPLPGFSADPHDHLVVVYPDISQQLINHVEIAAMHATISADYYTTAQQIALTPTRVKLTDTRSQTSPLSTDIPINIISQLEKTLLTSPDIQHLFGSVSFKNNQYSSPTIYNFNIDKCHHHCPYANRAHRHNRSFFEYNYKHNTLRYKCYNAECQDIQHQNALVFQVSSFHDALNRLVDLDPTPTLHDKENIILWNECYDTPSMSPYPLKPLVVIRANMGTGKTYTLMYDFMAKNCSEPNVKCLFITYQILLSKKYHETLRELDFVNYHDVKGPITDNKIIVCLDSLHRVRTQNFDFIFIDEVLSVLLHFNSSLMKNVSSVSTLFELLLLQAEHVYLLDAAADNAMVYNFVNYLAGKKNTSVYYIRNKHVKNSNRNCNLYLNRLKGSGYPQALRNAAFQKVASMLVKNKKVVVSSSTKGFTKELHQYLKKQPGMEMKRIIIYNSDSEKSLLHAHASNLNAKWLEYDAVIYSPTIGAGLSFDPTHFDNLVGYMENSFKAPTVDLILQQLFRVRNLKSGQMDLYVDDSVMVSPTNFPTRDEHVEDWLDTNERMMHEYFPPEYVNYESSMVVDVTGIRYDKSRLSYSILKGIMTNKNKSLMSYNKTILNTLRTDYNIPCTICWNKPITPRRRLRAAHSPSSCWQVAC
jgi:hypothetical protein